MDRRIEAFLADVLALAGENPDAIREGGRGASRETPETTSGLLWPGAGLRRRRAIR